MKKHFQQRSFLQDGMIVIVYTLTGKSDRAHRNRTDGNMNTHCSPESGSSSDGISNQIFPLKFHDSQSMMAG